jgi:predicted LPLAT superfamily acyltransferase
MSESTGWTSMAERGSTVLLRFAVWFRLSLGRRVTALILYPTVSYFFLTSRAVRRASRDYLGRLHAHRLAGGGAEVDRFGLALRPSHPPRWWDPFLHILSFSESTLDRFCFWAGRWEQFDVQFDGREHLMRHVRSDRGAILLGAHLGSFDVLRVLATAHDIVVNVVMFTGNAQQINAVFKRLDPESDLRVIEVDPNSVRSAFEVKKCLDRGEFVAILGDRVGLGSRDRVGAANFLGAPAAFPESPFLMAVILRAPVLFTVALRTGPGRYHVIAEPFWEGEAVPRAERAQAVQDCVDRFANRLERYCALEPQQWFNFYDFWKDGGHA